MNPSLLIALRTLLRRPGASSTIVLTLALGIGAVSALFSVIDGVLLRPLPYPDSNRLMAVFETNAQRKMDDGWLAPVRLEEFHEQNRTFTGLTGGYSESVTESSGETPEKLVRGVVAPRFFSVLGSPMVLGRGFTAEEDRAGGPLAIVISEGFWRRRFHSDPQVLGKTLRGSTGASLGPIIGVAPETVRFPTGEIDYWVAAQFPQAMMRARDARFYWTVGRLRPGVSRQQAVADLQTIYTGLAQKYPASDAGWSVRVLPMRDLVVGNAGRPLWLLFGAVSLVLLIACGNVACLLLAWGTARERELAVRFSLGAQRSHIVRQLLTEGGLLALAGSLVGLLFAAWSLDALRSLAPDLPRLEEVTLDWRLMTFALSLSVLTTLVFSFLPAWVATRRERASGLATTGRGAMSGQASLQRWLVAAQVALAVVLLSGSGLLIHSFARLRQVSPGFDSSKVLTLRITASWGETADQARLAKRIQQTAEALSEVPGAEAAAASAGMTGQIALGPVQTQLIGDAAPEAMQMASWRFVTPDYFRVLRIPLLAGETCARGVKQVPGAVINRKLAEQWFARGRSPVGQRLQTAAPGVPATQYEIVGVAEDVREAGLHQVPQPSVYSCAAYTMMPDPNWLIRTKGDPRGMMAPMRTALAKIAPGRAVYALEPMDRVLDATLQERRFQTLLLTLFAALALVLAAVGLYGVMSYTVSQRTREIGLRMALGAKPRQVLEQVFRQGGGVVAAGMAAGLIAALGVTRLLRSLLFDTRTYDGLSLLGAIGALAVVAALAILVPARRAALIDPMVALREE